MHVSLEAALSFPAYYGKNLDALDECIQEDLAMPDVGGLVLVLYHYDQFARANLGVGSNQKSIAEVVLDIFARAVRYHMLFGRRLLILVQSDHSRIQFARLGGIAASGIAESGSTRIAGFESDADREPLAGSERITA